MRHVKSTMVFFTFFLLVFLHELLTDRPHIHKGKNKTGIPKNTKKGIPLYIVVKWYGTPLYIVVWTKSQLNDRLKSAVIKSANRTA